MNIKNGYFVDSIDDVRQSIENNTGRKVAQIPISLESANNRYYITDDGRVFFCKIISKKCFIIPKHHDKRHCSERFVRLSIGSGREIHVTVAQCVYNSFKVGKWLDLRPEYKNGNKDDYTLSNLYVPDSESDMLDTSIMYDCSTLYEKHFRHICNYLSYRYDLSVPDSEDIVQDSFIHVTCKKYGGNILYTWIWYCKKRAIDYLYRMRLISETILDIYPHNDEFDFPIFRYLKVKKDRDILAMRCEGFNNIEIANKLSISKGNVEARVSRAISLLRKILKRDIEYYGKRSNI